MHQENGMPFKSFVTTLMELLEDADGMVRDTARNAVIELFQNAPNAAKSDLKKQLKNFNVRPTIVSTITARLGPGGGPQEAEPDAFEQAPRPHLGNSVSMSALRPSTPVVEAKVEFVEPSYVNTQRELDDIFRDMHPFFEGKESEGNWLKREQSCTKIRRLNAGNAPSDFHDAFLINIKGLLDGILKAVNSLRTSLSKEGCSVVQEVARTAGSGLDPMVEILLQNLIKLCGGTKKIAQQAGNVTVDIIICNVSYNLRILQHIWLACQDKNVQPRTYATGWLKTLLKNNAHHKSHLEHNGGLDLLEKCIKKGLADPNPGVRENMRSTYWSFASIWPAKADAIMSGLDATQQRLLDLSPDNPNSPKKPDVATARPGLGFSKSVGPPKPSLRETMLAQKKAAMANKTLANLPARPGSAMSSFSPVRTVSSSSTASAMSSSSDAPPARLRQESTTVAHKGLSVAPMRPAKFKRPEIARPATAGPYSVRRPGHAPSNSDSTSPLARPVKIRAPSSAVSPPKKPPIPRPNTSHSSHASPSTHTSPAKSTTSVRSVASSKGTIGRAAGSPKVAGSPRSSPVKSKSISNLRASSSSPTKADEDFTMVVPTLSGLRETAVVEIPSPIESSDDEDVEVVANTPSRTLKVFEDPFSNSDHTTPRPAFAPVLGELPVNELPPMSPERQDQTSRLLESGITRIKAKSLDAHGLRKLKDLIKDPKSNLTNEKYDALLLGLFDYLEASLTTVTPEKSTDIKTQVLVTIRTILNKDRETFKPYVPRGIQCILAARSGFDSRQPIVSGLELLARELVTLAEPHITVKSIVALLDAEDVTSDAGCKTLSMGLHTLKELINAKPDFVPTDIGEMSGLASRCIGGAHSGVRMDAMGFIVALYARLGEERFWREFGPLSGDYKSLITYYVARKEKDQEV